MVSSALPRQVLGAGGTAVLAAGVFMANLDLFVVNLALPSLAADLGSSLTQLSWVLTAYAAVFAGLLVPLGRWADRVGRRRGYLTGLVLFAVASGVAGASPTLEALVGARVLQAVGAALVVPTSLSLVLAATEPARRAAAIGTWAAAGAAAAAAGPVLGGLLVEVSWRWVFLVNLPVAAAAVALTARLVPESREPSRGVPADLLGAAVLTTAVSLLALVLVQAQRWGVGSARTLAAATTTAVLLALFVRRSVTHPSPVVDRALLRQPVFVAANTASLLFYAAFAAMLLVLVVQLSGAWGYTPLRAGLGISPGPLVVLLVARRLTPRLLGARGPRAVALLGTAVFVTGFVQWAATWGAAPAYVEQVLPGLLLTGLGVGLVMPATLVAGSSSLPPERFATGSAVLTMSRQVGAVAGTAGLVALLGVAPGTDEVRRALLVAAAAACCVVLPARRLP